MKSVAELKKLIKLLKEKTGLTQEEISIQAGYEKKTLTQRISQGGDMQSVYSQLIIAFKETLNNSTSLPIMKPRRAAKAGDKKIEELLKDILTNLSDLRSGQTQLWNQGQMIRQDVAGVSNYLMLKDAEWDPEKLRELKDTYYKAVHAGPGEIS